MAGVYLDAENSPGSHDNVRAIAFLPGQKLKRDIGNILLEYRRRDSYDALL